MNGHSNRDPYRGREQIPLSNLNPGYEEAVFPDYPQNAYSGAGPSIPMERRGSDASSYHSDDVGSRQRNWAKEDGPRDTAILLESLPSKQLEKMASEIARDATWKKKSHKRKSLHGTLHIPRGKDVSEELIKNCRDDPDFAQEIDDDDIKEMPMTLSKKRKLKNEVSLKRKQPKNLSKWKQMKYNFSISWKHFKYRMAEFGYFLKLWRGHLKKIEGHFGTGVLSYFLFLKWLFYINIPVFLITFCFVILPQILYRHLIQPDAAYATNVTFTGKELLTGSDWFTNTELYYGYYTSTIFSTIDNTHYNMKYAYLFTCGGYYILCLFILAISISRSYKQNYIDGSGAFDFYYVTRVFCGWSYGITAKDAARLKHKSIFNELKEYLSDKTHDDEQDTRGEKCKWFCIRSLTNLVIVGLIGGSGYLIFYISDTQSVNVDIPVLSEMAMPLCVSGVNLILPFIFSFIASKLENYKKPKNELYISMLRTMTLKAVTLGVLVYFWYQRLTVPCWETFVGQQIYRLVIVDFIFILITTFFAEFVRRLAKDYCCSSLNYPEFEIGRNTLNLIYSQALCWLGTYFSPMLSLIMIIKLFLLFYVKRISVIQNCKPSLRPWRASRAHTIFLGFLFCFFILATAAVTCAIIFLKPSEACGPFKDYETSYAVVVELIDGWKDKYEALHTAVGVVSSSGFIAATLIVLVVLTYYMRIVMVGHKEMVELLRQQLSMEGRDKAYLLKMLQDANKKHGGGRPSNDSRLLSAGSGASSDMGGSVSPGGRQFIKQLAVTAEKTKAESLMPTPQRRRRRDGGVGGAASP